MKAIASTLLFLLGLACLLPVGVRADEAGNEQTAATELSQELRARRVIRRLDELQAESNKASRQLRELSDELEKVYRDTEDVAALLSEADRSKLMAEILLKQVLLAAEVSAGELVQARRAEVHGEVSRAETALARAQLEKTEIAMQLAEKQLHVAEIRARDGHAPEMEAEEMRAKLQTLKIEHAALEAQLQRSGAAGDLEAELQLMAKRAQLEAMEEAILSLKASSGGASRIRLLRMEIQQVEDYLNAINERYTAAQLDLMEVRLDAE